MILSCNSCEKKFVVPDQAITLVGRVVQCSSCGNKWKQFPVKNEAEETASANEIKVTNDAEETTSANETKVKKSSVIPKTKKTKKNKVKKNREIHLYSPEYLEKKHGISLSDVKTNHNSSNQKVSFGFYNSLVLFVIISIALSRSLYFFQDFIVQKLPFSEYYLDYFFENIRNIFEIWKNLIFNY